MLPTTVMYFFGMGILVLGYFQGNSGVFTTAYLYLAALLLLPGYSLYSLWWLILKYKKMTVREVPIFIWLGISVGVVFSIYYFSPFNLTPPTEFISNSENLKTKLVFGLGPFIVLTTLVTIMWSNNGSNKRN